ncbi:MAG: 6-carboxytetrahydropterin synthase [Planctomycetes bacterium]|nr:6-carboxytetrahydropterin synthase [Planctomycetota bacterium]
MYELVVKTNFAAAHNLRQYRGQCERLHGHNWAVDVYLQSAPADSRQRLNKLGMVIDFKDAKKYINQVLKKFDHRHLNTLKEFAPNRGGPRSNRGGLNPTTENLARVLHGQIQKKLKGKKIIVTKVCVWESPACGVCYQE